MLKILQARLQQYMNQEGPDIQAGFRKGRGTRDQVVNIYWMLKKHENSRKRKRKIRIIPEKTSSVSLSSPKPLTTWITRNCGKFLKRWGYQTTLPVSWETCMQVKKRQLEPDKKQWTGLKLRKEYIKAVYCHPAHLTSMQRTSCKILDWMNHKLESIMLLEISVTSDMQMIPL